MTLEAWFNRQENLTVIVCFYNGGKVWDQFSKELTSLRALDAYPATCRDMFETAG